MPDFNAMSLSQLVASGAALVDRINSAVDGYYAWAVGTADGGPNGDGFYPLPVAGAPGYRLVPCPDKLAAIAAACNGQSPAVTRYIAPVAAGDQSGSSWVNAAPLSSINSLIEAVGPNGRVWLRADAGPYTSTGVMILDKGGEVGAPVVIQGVDGAGAPMQAEIVGTRANPWTKGAAYGVEVFRIAGGPGHLTFRHLLFRNQGPGCIRVGAPIAGLTIEDCSAYNVGTFLENTITGGATDASISGLIVRRCDAHGYSKKMCRIQYNSSNILLEDLLGDSERQDRDDFAVGIGFYHTAHGAILRRCTMNNHIDTTRSYQNGDGFSGERGNSDILLEDCSASWNTDGGVDFKGDNIRLVRFTAEGNHRNYRLWGTADLIDCIGIEPKDNAGANPYSKANVSVFTNGLCRVIGGVFSQTITDAVFLAESGGLLALDPSAVVIKPAAAPLSRVEIGSNGEPDGVFTMIDPDDITAPIITTSPSVTVPENRLGVIEIAANKPAQLRIVGGVDAAVFSTLGPQLRLSRQDYEDPDNPDHIRQVNIRMIGTNGRASPIQYVSATIADAADDPITPEILFGSGGPTDGLWYDASRLDTLWQDVEGTVPAVVDQPVGRIDDLSGHGRHARQSDPAQQGVLRQAGGVSWIEVDGTQQYLIAAPDQLMFAQNTVVVMQRRTDTDGTTAVWLAAPRSTNPETVFNGKWWVGYVGNVSVYARIDPNNFSSDAGNPVGIGQDRVISLQTATGELRVNAELKTTGTGQATLTYPAGVQARLFADGQGIRRATGRFYAAVLTNRTEDADTRFRLERQLAEYAGLVL